MLTVKRNFGMWHSIENFEIKTLFNGYTGTGYISLIVSFYEDDNTSLQQLNIKIKYCTI